MFMGDGTRVQVAFSGVFILHLSTNIIIIIIIIELKKVVFIPSIRRNLISIPILDRLGYSFLFGAGKS